MRFTICDAEHDMRLRAMCWDEAEIIVRSKSTRKDMDSVQQTHIYKIKRSGDLVEICSWRV